MKKDKLQTLTPRQKEVFECILKGMNNKQIAQKLRITYGTAKLMSNTVLKKLNCASKLILVATYLK